MWRLAGGVARIAAQMVRLARVRALPRVALRLHTTRGPV